MTTFHFPQSCLCLLFCLLLDVASPLPTAAFDEPVAPIPSHADYNRAKALLGRTLFSDPILSLDRTVSCASCHDLNYGGSDPQPVSTGVNSKQGVMNAPTVFNAVFNFRQFWNGRARDLREQADGPIHNPVEMQMPRDEAEQRLNADPAYRQAFQKVYGKERIEHNDVLDAIAEFEKALITPNCRFDRYLQGQIDLTADEKTGYHTFKTLGCITCHNGVNLGGNSYQKVGALNPFVWDGRHADRFQLTKDPFDQNVYKVPTLRNIELTAPYFHDGSQATLKASLEAMAFHNLGLKLSFDEERTLVAFLKTLTGQRPEILTVPTATSVSARG